MVASSWSIVVGWTTQFREICASQKWIISPKEGVNLKQSLGIQSPSENGNGTQILWLDTLIIIWEYDWIPREYLKPPPIRDESHGTEFVEKKSPPI